MLAMKRARRDARRDGGLVDRASPRGACERCASASRRSRTSRRTTSTSTGRWRPTRDAKARLFLELRAGDVGRLRRRRVRARAVSRIAGPKLARERAAVAASADVAPTCELVLVGARHRGVAADAARRRSRSRSPLVGAHNVENLVVALGCVVRARARRRRAAPTALARDRRRARAARALRRRRRRRRACSSTTRTRPTRSRACSTRVRARHEAAVASCASSAAAATAIRRSAGRWARPSRARADVAIVTSDNPRTEAPEAIADAHRGGRCGDPRRVADADVATRARLRRRARPCRARSSSPSRAARPATSCSSPARATRTTKSSGPTKRHFDDRARHARAALARRARGNGAASDGDADPEEPRRAHARERRSPRPGGAVAREARERRARRHRVATRAPSTAAKRSSRCAASTTTGTRSSPRRRDAARRCSSSTRRDAPDGPRRRARRPTRSSRGAISRALTSRRWRARRTHAWSPSPAAPARRRRSSSCAALLERVAPDVGHRRGNLNNLVGVPAVVFALERAHRFAVDRDAG